MERGQKILTFARAVQATFSSSEWTEIGYLTGTDEWIDRHPRLLRSLNWGDDDYRGNALDAVAHILKNAENFRVLFEYAPINRWLKENEPGAFTEFESEVSGLEVPDVVPGTVTDSGLAALADAQELLRTRGPTSAVDRLHTGLHDFLKAACDQAGIQYPATPSPNQLLKALLEQHPALSNLGPRSEDIKRILRTSGSIIDSFGTLRNQASLAHPNQDLLDHDEALLVINISRSLLRFFDAKFR